MQSTINDNTITTFPRLMKATTSSNFIVLFIAPRKGTVVHSGTSGWSLGHNSAEFIMEYFEPFNGTITLSNSN